MTNPAFIVPGALDALLALGKAAQDGGVPQRTLDLVHLRASRINGCSVRVHMHSRDLKKAGETDERLWTVAGWRDAPYFTDAERVALALAEAVTRAADRADQEPDEAWDEAAEHYDEKALGSLVASVALINLWNRLNLATRQVAGQVPA